ncbi:type 1 glutamine amidotransferase [Candidatus Synechococcus calcipolaris G9]|uniref:Type 1 glutamine amidotransferase n=1 Tax=Candidatus Synechococcus calcipolaris G9 TaxID=1497997 RepID=A0ABT6F232_9SYNE|nr:type 1 glutamine amidotransferase [Candidatus Synechococcus calcipolaris]MDG2991831.1 type 1 glutamine amidotransferase [Candidatus Synechococcus calcipolaris G9]
MNSSTSSPNPCPEHLRILLLQARNDPTTQAEELAEFIRFSHLNAHQFTVLNGFDCPDFTPNVIDGYDALFVGGSSDASVLHPDRYPFVPAAEALLLSCIERKIPVLASCFGFQIAVQALGGTIILDRPNMEMGTYRISLTPAAQTDPLFQDVPDSFLAVSGHQERALTLPEGVIHLAQSDRCPYHAFRLPNLPFYGFQFHPEVDRQDLIARISRYCDRYFDDPEHLQQMIQKVQETPISNQLIRQFIEKIVLEPNRISLASPLEKGR